MLTAISVMTGISAGTLALLQAQKQPHNARQLRLLSLIPFGMAGLMLPVYFT